MNNMHHTLLILCKLEPIIGCFNETINHYENISFHRVVEFFRYIAESLERLCPRRKNKLQYWLYNLKHVTVGNASQIQILCDERWYHFP